MLRQIDHCWRLVFTGVAFAALGVGGTILAATVFPPIAWLTRDPVLRQRRIQEVVRWSFRVYVGALKFLGLISVQVANQSRLDGLRGKLIVANHPTLLDIVLLMSMTPRAQCIVKHQLWRNLFLRSVVRGAAYIRNDQEPSALLASCADTLRAGNNLIIFPEGTRSRPGHPVRFRRGFANIAIAANADIQMVTIVCDPPTLTKGEPWYRIPPIQPNFSINIGEAVDIRSFACLPHRSIAARRIFSHLERYYAEVALNGKSGTRDQALDHSVVEVGRSVA
jgi:1-acyl-sn-glycerol-3-phosphate acyltransferase